MLFTTSNIFCKPSKTKLDYEISRNLVSGAKSLLTISYNSEALELLREAVEFCPINSDANYLLAILEISNSSLRNNAIKKLENAIEADNFFEVSKDEALIVYTSLLLDTLNYNKAFTILNSTKDTADSLILKVRANLLVNNLDKALEISKKAINLAPEDARTVKACLNAMDNQSRTKAQINYINYIFDILPLLKQNDNSILYLLAPFAESIEKSRSLLREYRAIGKAVSKEIYLSLYYGLIDEDQAINELFELAEISIIDIKELYSKLRSDQNRINFITSFEKYSGIIVDDKNKDLLNETSIAYKNGIIQSASYDSNQDGLTDIHINFSSGEIIEIVISYTDQNVVFSYNQWPYVNSVKISNDKLNRTWFFSNYNYKQELIELLPICVGRNSNPYYVAFTDFSPISENIFENLAFKVINEDTDIISDSLLYQGNKISETWQNEKLYRGIIDFVNGYPYSEVIDFDGDGIFEAKKNWIRSSNKLPIEQSIFFDNNNDGIFEYRESYIYPYTKSWDYDSDGHLDMSYDDFENGKEHYQFFSSTDGSSIFVSIDNKKIEYVIQNGKELHIVNDIFLQWIGTMPFSLNKEESKVGYGIKNGIRYRVININGKLYAQILE